MTRAMFTMVVVSVAALVLIAACGGSAETPTPNGTTSGVTGSFLQAGTGGEISPDTQALITQLAKSDFSLPVAQYAAGRQVGISVGAQGQVTTAPDLVILNAGVEARANTVADARTQAAQAMEQVMKALENRGIQSGDIQTRFFNISPEYVWNEQTRRRELVGFLVSNQITVKIRDVGSAGLVIDEVAASGGDLARVQGVTFTVEDTEALEMQAREKAVLALLKKAQQFADLTNVNLGAPIFLSESGGFVPKIQFLESRDLAAAVASPTTTISPGELTVSVSVQGVFSIL